MAHKISLINMKGGVGKSTLAVQLAWAMATPPYSKNVLVVDLDPQFNCSQYLLGIRRIESIFAEERPTVWNIMEQFTAVPGQPPAPFDSSDAVVNVYNPPTQGSLALIPSRLELSQTLRNPSGKEHLLKRALEQFEESYDIIIIDCAPTESVLTTAAYLASDYILIPVRPEFLSTIGLPLLERSLEVFDLRYPGETPEVLGIVFNAHSDYSPEEFQSKSEVRKVASDSEWPIFDNEIKYSRSFPKSAREGSPIFRTSHAHYTVKQNFRAFAHEFTERIEL